MLRANGDFTQLRWRRGDVGRGNPSRRAGTRRTRRIHVPQRPEGVRSLHDHALCYAPVARVCAFDALRSSPEPPVSLAALETSADRSLAACVARLAVAGIRIGAVDATPPDIALGPFRVVRALGTNLQPIHVGFGMERQANPRLCRIHDRTVNAAPHPLC